MSFIRNIALSKAERFGPITEYMKPKHIQLISLKVSSSRMNIGFITLSRRQRTIHAVETPHLPFSKEGQYLSSAAKITASAYCDSNVVMFIDYLQKAHCLNWDYSIKLLRQLWKAIMSQSLWKLVKDELFYLDNAAAYTSFVSMTALFDFGFALVDSTPDTPDLTFIYSRT